MAGGQGSGVLGALDSVVDGQQGGELVPGPGRIPGLSGPVGEVVAGVEGSGVLGALDPFADRQQGGELVPGPGRIPGLPGPVGEVVAGGQGGGVLGAQDPFADRQQGGELVPGPGRIPGLPGPVGEIVAGGQGVGMLGAVRIALLVCVSDQPEQVPGRRVTAAVAEGLRDLPNAVAGQVKDGAGVRQEHRGYRPRRGKLRVRGDRPFDQGGGGLFPLGCLIRGELGAGNGLHQAVHQN